MSDTVQDNGNPQTERTQRRDPMEIGERGVVIRDTDDLGRVAANYVNAGMVPRGMTTAQAMAQLAFGASIGLDHYRSLWNLTNIRGRMSMWGDAMVALVFASGRLEDQGCEFEKDGACVYWAKRRGVATPMKWRFGPDDVKSAGLAGKSDSAHATYPRMMMFHRARAFVLRALFPDVLGGVYTVEEMNDNPGFDAQKVNQPSVRVQRAADMADKTEDPFVLRDDDGGEGEE